VERAGGVSALARAVGVSEAVIRKWRDGRSEPSRRHLLSLAEATGSDLQWLVSGSSTAPYEGAEPGHPYGDPQRLQSVALPHLDLAVAGTPRGTEEVRDFLPWRRRWLERHGVSTTAAAVVDIDNDAMAPTLHAGDWIIVDRSDVVLRDGAVYLLRAGGRTLVRRVALRADGGVDLIADARPASADSWSRAAFASSVEVLGRACLRIGRI
jgi:phage repressor protein C with HTH and peptisase S24 domain